MQTLDNFEIELGGSILLEPVVAGPEERKLPQPEIGAQAYNRSNHYEKKETVPRYGTKLVHRIEYKWIRQNECPPQYNHPFVIGWTVLGSDVSWKNMDFYFEVGPHEAIHHDPEIRSLNHHVLEEVATRIKDKLFSFLGYRHQSVPYCASYRIIQNSY